MKSVLFRSLPVACVLVHWATSAPAQQDEEPVIVAVTEMERLVELEGTVVTVYGEVSRTGESESGMNFVNFADTEFVLVTFASDVAQQFPDGEPHEIYRDKRLAVTGPIAIFRDNPQIKLTDPSMVRVLAPDEVFPPESEKSVEVAVAETGDSGGEDEEPEAIEPEPEEKPGPPVDWKLYFK